MKVKIIFTNALARALITPAQEPPGAARREGHANLTRSHPISGSPPRTTSGGCMMLRDRCHPALPEWVVRVL